MDAIAKFFNEYGWLANALGILVPLGGGILFFFRFLRPWLRKGDINWLLPKTLQTVWTIDLAKSIARIAIVDDQHQDFPINDLKSDGYQVQTFRHVQLANIQGLASYDIVFLDMKGIVKDDPDYGGLKLIAELRKLNPQQKICAVSGQTFDPTATEFFKQADDYKKKPLTAQECKTVIDSFIEESFDPSKLAAQGRGVLGTVPRSARVEVISAMRAFVDGSSDPQRLADTLVRLGIDKDSRAPLLTLARVLAREAK